MSINPQNDPEIPVGRDMIEHLVGRTWSPSTRKGSCTWSVTLSTRPCRFHRRGGRRIAIHSSYRAQTLIVELLELATRQQIALEEDGSTSHVADVDSERFKRKRLELWLRLRDDKLS